MIRNMKPHQMDPKKLVKKQVPAIKIESRIVDNTNPSDDQLTSGTQIFDKLYQLKLE